MKLCSALPIMIVLACSGCVLRASPPMESYDELSEPDLAEQVKDLASAVSERISIRYPQALVYVEDPQGNGMFGDALRYALGRGNALALRKETAHVSLVYALGELAPGTGYLNIRFSDGTAMAQSFALEHGEPALPLTAARLEPEKSLTPKGKDSESALETSALPLSPSPKPQNLIPLSRGVLTVLPARWKYTIPDVPKRSVQVEKVDHLPWRESIQRMAEDAGCSANFDEAARRVTIRARADQSSAVAMTPPVSFPSVATGSADSQHPLESAVPPVTDSLSSEEAESVQAAPVVSAALASLPVSPAQSSAGPPAETPAASSLSTYVSPPVAAVWELKPGSLASQLETWSIRAGFQLIWKAPHDLEMEAHSVFRGEFQDVVSRLFQGLHKSGNALRVTIYTANNVIEVAED